MDLSLAAPSPRSSMYLARLSPNLYPLVVIRTPGPISIVCEKVALGFECAAAAAAGALIALTSSSERLKRGFI